ncbi:hypothetical protein LPJ55_003908 [Coemansia sp. RSA 990]|nr:hypothetical protein LPJ68_003023 [Coemansia sp. RSA 1086]KAJ1749521.1 hypothetical protein LPJ79_003671 [Coemansia sp. RSA 1821]KAJ1871429.1 hypothetical protein LPJ55_003908 [Coemansia sp. RSA 990]KAJ2668706.1 hypothetical protein IWW42_005038 [Coemansia sp. RSA 1085]
MAAEPVIVEAKLVDEAVEVNKPASAPTVSSSKAEETVQNDDDAAADSKAADNSESNKTNNPSVPETGSIPAGKDTVNEETDVPTEHAKDAESNEPAVTESADEPKHVDETKHSAAKGPIVEVELKDNQGSATTSTAAADDGKHKAEQAEQDAEQQSEEPPEAAKAQSRPTTSEKPAETAKEATSENALKDKPKEAEPSVTDMPQEETEIERPRVRVYGSTVSGNRTYKKQVKELFAMLEAIEVDFEYVCIAADEQAKKFVRRKALGNMTIPQIYVDDELKGFYEDAFNANEVDELYEWLGLDEEPFVY